MFRSRFREKVGETPANSSRILTNAATICADRVIHPFWQNAFTGRGLRQTRNVGKAAAKPSPQQHGPGGARGDALPIDRRGTGPRANMAGILCHK